MAWFKRGKSGESVAGKVSLPPRRPLVMALEPRGMFDGAAAATAAAFGPEPAAHAPGAHGETAHAPAAHRPAAVWADDGAPHAFKFAGRDFADRDIAGGVASRNVLFVDARIQDAASLLAQVRPGTEELNLQK